MLTSFKRFHVDNFTKFHVYVLFLCLAVNLFTRLHIYTLARFTCLHAFTFTIFTSVLVYKISCLLVVVC